MGHTIWSARYDYNRNHDFYLTTVSKHRRRCSQIISFAAYGVRAVRRVTTLCIRSTIRYNYVAYFGYDGRPKIEQIKRLYRRRTEINRLIKATRFGAFENDRRTAGNFVRYNTGISNKRRQK